MSKPVPTSTTDQNRGSIPKWYLPVALVAVVWVLGFLAIYFRQNLPNSQNITRLQVLLSADDLLVDVVAPRAQPGEKVGWSYLPQRLSLLWASALMLLASWSLGRLALRAMKLFPALTPVENLVFASGVGLSFWSLIVLGCGLAGWMSRPLHLGLIAVTMLAEAICMLRSRRSSPPSLPEPTRTTGNPGSRPAGSLRFWRGVTLAACLPFLFCIVLGGLLPQVDFDTLEYHFGGPKEWFQTGQITFLPHNVYTSFPFLTEMFSLEGMVLKQDWFWGAVSGNGVLLWFQPLTALALYAAGKRWYGEPAGLLASWLYLSTPWIFRLSNIPYVEGGLLFYVMTTLYATWLTWETRAPTTGGSPGEVPQKSFALLAGLLAGSAMACKYPGVLSVVIPMGTLMLVGRRLNRWLIAETEPSATRGAVIQPWLGIKAAMIFSLGVILTVGPWLARNAVQTGNPVYPLLYRIFGGRDWDMELDAKFKSGHSPKHYDVSRMISAKNEDLLEVVGRHDWQSPLLFSLAPLAFLYRIGRRRTLLLWGFFVYLFLTWWWFTHRIDRFWLPVLPIVALLGGVGGTWVLGGGATSSPLGVIARRGWIAFLLATCGSVGLFLLAYIGGGPGLCGYNPFFLDLDQAAQRTSHLFSPQLVELNERLPPGSKVLCVGEAKIFEARFPLVYNTVFNKSIFEEWCGQFEPGMTSASRPFRPTSEIRNILAENGITHVYVNWLEILRYRTTYTYTDFVTPKRFHDLQQNGVLGPGWQIPTAFAPWDKLSSDYRTQVETWGPELRKHFSDGDRIATFEVFPVQNPRDLPGR